MNVRLGDRISTEELKTKFRLNGSIGYLQDRRLRWFVHLEGIEKSAWKLNVETSKLVVVCPEDDLGKHGKKLSEVI